MRRRLAALLAATALLAGCASEPPRPAPPPPQAQDAAALGELKQGRDLLQAQQPEAAIIHFDRAIALYEAQYAGEPRHLYCARDRDESILYTANAAAIHDPAGVLVLAPYWADAYFLEGYALNQLGRGDQAERMLRKASKLSPANAQYLSELAYILQARQDWVQSLELYRKADAASEFSPAPDKQHELGRALRGQGQALARLGQAEEAAKLYQRCLELNPDDDKARRELQALRRQPHP
jgi:tetratricopeptide (TPR) repeat protein